MLRVSVCARLGGKNSKGKYCKTFLTCPTGVNCEKIAVPDQGRHLTEFVASEFGHHRPLFHLFSVFSNNKQRLQQIKAKSSKQYLVSGFKLTASRTRVSSYNHYAKCIALFCQIIMAVHSSSIKMQPKYLWQILVKTKTFLRYQSRLWLVFVARVWVRALL